MSFVLTQSVVLTHEAIQKRLEIAGRYESEFNGRDKNYPNTLENPFILAGIYQVPVNWPVFWKCMEYTKSSEFKTDYPGEYRFDSYDLIKMAITYYKGGLDSIPGSEYFYQTRNALRKAEEDKKEAEKAEELRVRNAVPEITLKYDALLKENETLKKQIHSYDRHLNKIKHGVVDIDRRIGEGKYTKWLTTAMEELVSEAILYWKDGRWCSPGRPIHKNDFAPAERELSETYVAINEQEARIFKGATAEE